MPMRNARKKNGCWRYSNRPASIRIAIPDDRAVLAGARMGHNSVVPVQWLFFIRQPPPPPAPAARPPGDNQTSW